MIQLPDEFLAALGFAGLPKRGRDALLSKVHQQLELLENRDAIRARFGGLTATASG